MSTAPTKLVCALVASSDRPNKEQQEIKDRLMKSPAAVLARAKEDAAR